MSRLRLNDDFRRTLYAQTSAFGALLPILTKHYYKYHEDAEDSSKPNVIREKLAPAFFDFCSVFARPLGSSVRMRLQLTS